MRTTWTFHSAQQLLFGKGAVRQLGEVGQRVGAKRALIVTDPNLVRAGLEQQLRVPLTESSIAVEVFPGGEPEPSFAVAEACLNAARTFRPDVLVGLGGGSNMDLAKITATVVPKPTPN